MMLLALLRHADTRWSSEGRIQGQVDVALSEEGRSALRNRTFPEPCRGMRVVTSPLTRCVETAALLGARDAAVEPRIVEMHWGDWQGRCLAQLRAEFGEAMRANESRGFDFTPQGGESPRQVLARVRPWLAELAARGQPTCAVTHRGVIRVIVAAAFGWDLRGRPPVKLDWGAAHLFSLNAAGAPSAWRMNVPLGSVEAAAAR
jgi:broad specificity phosphatase PhoE